MNEWERKQAERTRVRVLLGVAGSLLAVGGFIALVQRVNNPPPKDEHERFTDVAPFVDFSSAGDAGWVGRVDASWAGMTEASVATAACDKLVLRLAPTGDQTILIVDAGGLPVKECLPK